MQLLSAVVGSCKGGCNIFGVVRSNGDAVLFHNADNLYVQRRALPLLEYTNHVYTDLQYLLPAGCNRLPLDQCSFNQAQIFTQLRDKWRVFRSPLCDKVEGVVAECNYKKRYEYLPREDLVELLVSHIADLHRPQFS